MTEDVRIWEILEGDNLEEMKKRLDLEVRQERWYRNAFRWLP